MSRPTAYEKSTSFASYARSNPSSPYNAPNHDTEFDNIALALGQTQAALSVITRSDGKLLNKSVRAETLSNDAIALITGTSFSPKGDWVTATSYVAGDMVIYNDAAYVCLLAHTSGTFITDLTAAYWQLWANNAITGVPSDVDVWSGDAVTTDFTLSITLNDPAEVLVFVDGKIKIPTTDYTLISSGTKIHFLSAPALGTNNVVGLILPGAYAANSAADSAAAAAASEAVVVGYATGATPFPGTTTISSGASAGYWKVTDSANTNGVLFGLSAGHAYAWNTNNAAGISNFYIGNSNAANTGSLLFYAAGVPHLSIPAQAGANQYVELRGSVSNGPRVVAAGTADANLYLSAGTGAGSVYIYTNNVGRCGLRVDNGSTGGNFVTIAPSSGNPTIGVNAGSLAISSAVVCASTLSAAGITITGGATLTLANSVLLSTSVALFNGAGASAGTLTNAPAAGNPTKWIQINDNGTTRHIPAW